MVLCRTCNSRSQVLRKRGLRRFGYTQSNCKVTESTHSLLACGATACVTGHTRPMREVPECRKNRWSSALATIKRKENLPALKRASLFAKRCTTSVKGCTGCNRHNRPLPSDCRKLVAP